METITEITDADIQEAKRECWEIFEERLTDEQAREVCLLALLDEPYYHGKIGKELRKELKQYVK